MVRLKVFHLSIAVLSQSRFNSTMVRLKEMLFRIELRTKDSFNSTMVRLKADSTRTYFMTAPLFQFHNGSIKSAESMSIMQDVQVSIPQWFD